MNETQKARFSEALSRLAGDEEMLLILADIAIEDLPPMVVHLSEQLADDELTSAAATAHAMKGLLSSFETGTPTSELQALINAARSGNTSEAQALYTKTKPAIEQLLAEIETLVQNNQPS
ncbi:hypothetical protein [Neorhodopirellula pilleata]|uniref:Hpt domain protein n=1 Tax=Neorhodopirellula pilleata TaxID=2714738 RepID=A0A5C6A386_9BACT|nr:hypothetical protein [Neorhodopirellula pilleata]TWT93651.1 hypothetical protein Pla100_41690 [Neorhodopirellula pilleata]